MPEYVREQSLFEAHQVSPESAEEIAQWCHGTAVDEGVQVNTTWGLLVIPHGCWVVYDLELNEFDAMSDRYFSQVCFQQSNLAHRVMWMGTLLAGLVLLGVVLAVVFG